VSIINLYSKEDFLKIAEIDNTALEEWQKNQLLEPAGYYDNNTPYYNEETAEKAEKLKGLMTLGFGMEEIKKIKAATGIPTGVIKKGFIKGKLFTVGELSEKTGISTRSIKYWEEKDLIQPDARSEGGFRLYRESFVEICQRIRELQLFGYSVEELKNMNLLLLPGERLQEEAFSFPEEKKEKILEEFTSQQKTLIEKISELKKAIKRWEGITKNQAKLINRLKKIKNIIEKS